MALPPNAFGRRKFLGYAAAAGAIAALLAARPYGAFAQVPNVAELKIGMIGAGREGGALGRLFAQHGHPVMFATRHPDRLGELVASVGPNARAGAVGEAIAFADVVVIAVPYTAVEQIATDHGTALAAKLVVIDVSNPIARRDGEDFVKKIEQQGGPGLAAQKMMPGVRLVRAFNAIGAGRLAELSQRQGEIGVPIAGDDPTAIEVASALIRQLGFEPVLVGGLAMGKYLVPGTPLAGEHPPGELRRIAATLK
jgi:8-hydroxy-5-deazaflavin:NADPH oxidoreductase